MRIVFFGTGEIGVPALRSLMEGSEVVAVVTQPDRPAGRDMKLRPSAIKVCAGTIPVLQPKRIRSEESLSELAAFGADLFVVAAYGQILPASLLCLPRLGCINIHASLLPRHRGASPIHAAILSGDEESGVTIMWVNEGLDTGDILLKRVCSVSAHETAGSLHDRLADLAPEALQAALELIERGEAPHIPQENGLATYAPKISKADGDMDWTLDAVTLERRVRGLHPWPGSSTLLPDGKFLKIHRADALPSTTDAAPGTVLDARTLVVATGSGALELSEVQIEGGRRQDSAAFLRGHSLPAGTRL